MAEGASRHDHAWAERIETRRQRHRRRSRVYRVGYAITGLVVLLTGLAMLVLPGPALVVIPVGLAMLAMEFAWADRALGHALHHADRAQRKAREASPRQRALGVIATLLTLVALLAAWLAWEIPVIPG